MCIHLRMPDGRHVETMGELMDWRRPFSIPILAGYYPMGITAGRDSCLCPVDLDELAFALGARIDRSDPFTTILTTEAA